MEDSSDSTSNLGELTSKICPTRRRLARTNGKARVAQKATQRWPEQSDLVRGQRRVKPGRINKAGDESDRLAAMFSN